VYRRCLKPIFDYLLALLALMVLWPIMLATAALVRLKLGAPVIFRQQRPGLHGRPFIIYKFRTMTEARDERGKLRLDAERLTPLGRLLRATSLDELPELWNVLRGELSLVGPRPLLMQYLERYTPEQARRNEVKPGITGWSQIKGRNAVSWDERFKLDVWYVDNQSFRLDLKIMALTLVMVVKREGINQPGQATMEEFRGGSKNPD